MTNVALLHEATDHGLTIRATGENLAVQPASRCPATLAATLRVHKPELLALLRLEFLMVRSATLNETLFFAANEEVKSALVEAGAESGCVYTREELRLLIDQHRREAITAADLLRLHAAKRIFNGRIVSSQRGAR